MTDQELAQIIWKYMRYEQPLERADVIIGLGSFYQETADWCAKLWTDGWAPKILFCGNTGTFSDTDTTAEAVRYARRAEELGVEKSAIIVEPESRNTGENIVFGQAMLHQHGISPQIVILATVPCFLRRGYATAMKQWPSEPKPRFICSGPPLTFMEYMVLDTAQPDIIDIIVGNLGRMRTFARAGFQIQQEIPHEVWGAYEELVRRGYTKYQSLSTATLTFK